MNVLDPAKTNTRETSLRRIPLADPRSDLVHIRDEILAGIARVIDSGVFVLGREVAELERDFARRLKRPGAVGVGCGTDALVLALLAVGVTAGDEVVTVSHTAGATVAAIRMTGAVPVLIDIDPETYCLDPALLEAAIGPRTRAVVPVHLYGHPADLDEIWAVACKHNIAVIEDCAQGQEATIGQRLVGAIGDAACFSFYPTKILGGVGDGGMVVASRPEIIDRVRQLRAYGWNRPQFAEAHNGRCSRLDELQAAILNVKLKYTDRDVEHRRRIAKRYDAAFADLPVSLPAERADCAHVYHLYVLRCEQRDELARHLDRSEIATGIHYPFAVHMQPGLAEGARIPAPLKATEMVIGRILSLPIYPSMLMEDAGRVISSVREFYGK